MKSVPILQYAQAEDQGDAYLLVQVQVELPDEGYRETQDRDVENQVGYIAQDIHEGVVGRGYAESPITPDWPNLKKGREDERNEPAQDKDYEDFDNHWESAEAEDSSVEAEDGELNQSNCNDIPELKDQKCL